MQVIGHISQAGRLAVRLARKAARFAVVVGVAATVAASPARAQDGDAKSGIAKAKAAGISIDPKAEEIMAAAPAGSCLNDPTQAKCDTPERIVADGQARLDGGTSFANVEPATASLTTDVAAAMNTCWVYATSLVKSTGKARAYGKLSCTSVVDVMELYVTLWMLYKSDGALHQVCVGSHPPSEGGGSIYANCGATCRDTAKRYFQNMAEGYADINGEWYAAIAYLDADLYCVV